MQKLIVLFALFLASFLVLNMTGETEKPAVVNAVGAIDDKPTPRMSSLETAHNYIDAAMDNLMNGEEVEVKTNTPYGCTVKYGS